MHRRRGYHTSAIIWLFSFTSFIFSLPSLYTFSAFYRSRTSEEVASIRPHSLIFFVLHFVLLFLFFLLTCVADRKTPGETYSKSICETDQINNTNGKVQSEAEVVTNGGTSHNNHHKKEVKVSNEKEKVTISKECPDQSASFLSLLTFWWLNGLTISGYKKALTLEDLPLLSEENLTHHIEKQYDEKWFREEQFQVNDGKKGDKKAEPGILGTILRAWALPFAAGAALKLAGEMVQFVNPQLQKYVFLICKIP